MTRAAIDSVELARRPGEAWASHHRGSGLYDHRTQVDFLAAAALEVPRGLALIDGGRRITYAELWRSVCWFAAGLRRLGVGPGSVVSAQLPNWAETVIAHHATVLLSGIWNPIVPIYRGREMEQLLFDAKPAVVIVPHRFRGFDHAAMIAGLRRQHGLTAAPVVVRPEGPAPAGFRSFESIFVREPAGRTHPPAALEPCLLLYTSGTTGSAKGVLHSHESIVYEARTIVDSFGLTADDVIFMASPLTHITGLVYGTVMPALLGCPAALQDVWDPEAAVAVIEAERATFTVGATPFLDGLTQVYDRLQRTSSLRGFVCGGADVPPALVRRASRVLNALVVRAYGLSELPTYCFSTSADDPGRAESTDGRAPAHAQHRIEDQEGRTLGPGEVGELLIAAPELFLGYRDASLDAGAFAADGLFRTGDLASVDSQGYITIQGRKKDIIVRNGEKFSAKEVEDLLSEHPAVLEVAVVAVPDAAVGERACACVVLRAGARIDVAEMSRFLDGSRVARQKHPELLLIVAGALPKTPSGKVQKFRLREQACRSARPAPGGEGSRRHAPGRTRRGDGRNLDA